MFFVIQKVCICFHLKVVDREKNKKNLFPTVLLPYYIPPILRQNDLNSR